MTFQNLPNLKGELIAISNLQLYLLHYLLLPLNLFIIHYHYHPWVLLPLIIDFPSSIHFDLLNPHLNIILAIAQIIILNISFHHIIIIINRHFITTSPNNLLIPSIAIIIIQIITTIQANYHLISILIILHCHNFIINYRYLNTLIIHNIILLLNHYFNHTTTMLSSYQ